VIGRVLLATVIGTLAGCTAEHAAAPAPARTTLTRPVQALAAGHPVRIPRAALVERAGVPGVFVLAGGEARFRMVREGRRHGDQVVILAGLRGDETLVLGDLGTVHDGSPITAR